MNIEEVKNLADVWQEEDPKGRAIMVISIEATELSEENLKADITSYVNGPAFLCKEAIKGIIKDGSPNNAFRKVLNCANLEVLTDKLTETWRD